MRQLIFYLAVASAAAFPTMAGAQIKIDMSRVTCGDYLAMPPQQASVFSAWMSGWFNQKGGYVWVDLDAYAKNIANVRAYCASNPNDTVMATLQRSASKMVKP